MESIDRDFNLVSRFDKVNFNFYGYKIKNQSDIEIDLHNTILQIKSFYLTGREVDLSLTGIVDISKNMDLHARGNIDIAPLRSLTDKITFITGMSEFDVDVYGSWEEPEAIGDIYVKDGSVKIESIPYRLSNFNGTLHLNRDKIVFESIESDFAGGTMTLSGVGYFRKLDLERLFLSSTMKGIRVRPLDKVQAVFDGTLFYESSPDVSALAGTIEIVKARYEKNVDLASLITGVKEVRLDASEYPDFARKTNLNIRISGNDNIFIDTNIARTPVQLDLNIIGTVDQYGLIGRVDTGEGTIYFRGNEFNILTGSNVEFIESERIAPVFHIMADTYISSHYIKLTLDGSIDNFSLTLFSDPPLPERDILTLLTLGEVDSESRGFESGLAASEAASALVGGVQDAMEDKFKSITGLERFRVEPHITTSGALMPRVTVEKRLLEDKLFVVYSSSLGTTEESLMTIKYNLNKNISLIGTRDELGSAGGDIKFRFEFR
jgi:translocation and assembly module TamB